MNTVSYAAPHRSPSVVDRDLREARNQLALAPRHNLQALRDRVQELTTKAVLDSGNWKSDLLFAQRELEQAQSDIAAKHGLTQRIVELEAEHAESERLDGVAQREEASRLMSAAMNEFRIHALNAGRAYRQMVLTARRIGMTQRLPDFHSSTLVPMSWTGTASEILTQNPDGLPDLVPAKEAA